MSNELAIRSEFYDELSDYLVGQLIDQIEELEGINIELLDFETSLKSIESVEKELYNKLRIIKKFN